MVRFAVILSLLFSAASIESAVATPSCAYKYRGQPNCVEKCKDGWSRAGRLLGSNPWGPVIGSATSKAQLDAYIAQACGSPVPSSTAQPTSIPSGPINAAPLPTTTSATVTTASSSVSTSSISTTATTTTSSTTSTTTSTTVPSSTSTSTSTTSSLSANIAPTSSSSRAPVTSSSSSTRVTSTTTTRTTPSPTATSTRTTTTAPPTSSAPSSGSGTSGGDIQAYLNAHNSVRRNHGAVDLTWSDSLAAAAQRWANNCKFEHSKGAVGPFGENLSAGTGMSIARAVQLWTDEVSEYNPANPVFSHFTQVVWKGTTQVGCAVQTCTGIFGNTPAQFYVCEYNPPGNVAGRFGENVQV